MSEELFEVAFSGVILEGQNPDEVKARVGQIFKANDAKLAQLFSGDRVLIKRSADEATAAKYKAVLKGAGADCEIKSLNPAPEPAAEAAPAAVAETAATAPSASPEPVPVSTPTRQGDNDVPPPPQTDPLGITGDQIEDLPVSIAPVGSAMKEEYQEVAEPQFDTSQFDVAPVGAELTTGKKQPDPPPPDTSGISMAD